MPNKTRNGGVFAMTTAYQPFSGRITFPGDSPAPDPTSVQPIKHPQTRILPPIRNMGWPDIIDPG
jgi:hypothetical protein